MRKATIIMIAMSRQPLNTTVGIIHHAISLFAGFSLSSVSVSVSVSPSAAVSDRETA